MGWTSLIRLECVLDTYRAIENRNIPINALIACSTARDWSANDPTDLLPISEHYSILETAAELTGSPVFGLETSHVGRPYCHNVFLSRIYRNHRLFEALTSYCRLISWYCSTANFWLHQACDAIWLCRSQPTGSEKARQLHEQRVLMSMIGLIRFFAGKNWLPRTILLSAGPQPRLEDTDLLADVTIRYSQAITSIEIPRYLIGSRTILSSVQMSGCDDAINTAFPVGAPARDFAGTVEQVIQTLLPVTGARIETVADLLGISVRTLQRELSRSGFRYIDLLENLRFEIASSRLLDNAESVVDIALSLGYSDASHFSRAFRRWAGIAPREFRRSHGTKSH